MSRTHAPLALLVALTLALTGCGGAQKMLGKAGPSPAPTAAFASEEEALAAAVAVYDRYTKIGDQIGQEGGKGAERLSEVVTGAILDESVAGFASWIEKGWRQVGSRVIRDTSLQQFSPSSLPTVVIYVCEDISGVEVVDSTDQSVVSPDRADSNRLQVGLDLGSDGSLRVSSRERWDDKPCW